MTWRLDPANSPSTPSPFDDQLATLYRWADEFQFEAESFASGAAVREPGAWPEPPAVRPGSHRRSDRGNRKHQ